MQIMYKASSLSIEFYVTVTLRQINPMLVHLVMKCGFHRIVLQVMIFLLQYNCGGDWQLFCSYIIPQNTEQWLSVVNWFLLHILHWWVQEFQIPTLLYIMYNIWVSSPELDYGRLWFREDGQKWCKSSEKSSYIRP